MQEGVLPSTTSAESKRSRTVSAEAKYDGQSPQEAKISSLVYTLCCRGCSCSPSTPCEVCSEWFEEL